jgi:ubiquinol-cytochrome c reductase cytochrome b subunit
VIAAVVILHIWALHIPGSSNPTGVDVKDEKDTLPFHPFYTAKDGWFAGGFLLLFALVVFFAPNALGHPDNYIPANPLATPAHIVPEWYFWPFYAILRAFTTDFILEAKLWGVLAMFTSILLLFFLPWLDKSPVRSGNYRPVFKRFFWLLVVDVLVLGWAGGQPATALPVAIGQIASAYYFAHFLIIIPLVSRYERPLPLPRSISDSVLHGEEQESAPAGVKPRKTTRVAG